MERRPEVPLDKLQPRDRDPGDGPLARQDGPGNRAQGPDSHQDPDRSEEQLNNLARCLGQREEEEPKEDHDDEPDGHRISPRAHAPRPAMPSLTFIPDRPNYYE